MTKRRRKADQQTFDRGVTIANEMLAGDEVTQENVRAAVEKLVVRNDPIEVEGYLSALRALAEAASKAATTRTPNRKPTARRRFTAASYAKEMDENLARVRAFKAFMRTVPPNDPRIGEVMADLKAFAARWRDQRERFEAMVDEPDRSQKSRLYALRMAETLRQGEEELGADLGHRLQ